MPLKKKPCKHVISSTKKYLKKSLKTYHLRKKYDSFVGRKKIGSLAFRRKRNDRTLSRNKESWPIEKDCYKLMESSLPARGNALHGNYLKSSTSNFQERIWSTLNHNVKREYTAWRSGRAHFRIGHGWLICITRAEHTLWILISCHEYLTHVHLERVPRPPATIFQSFCGRGYNTKTRILISSDSAGPSVIE